ncbi:mechanosensitive ion channel family protein [Saprospiraceae bacterium]|nr:mechanosensitive ion channel family protein [Saprospiraceae bacterium]
MEQILADLTEEWNKYYDYFIELLPKMVVGVIASALFIIVASFVKRKLMNYVIKKIDDPLLGNFLRRIMKSAIWIIATLLFLSIIGKTGIVTSILGVAGISAFVIGFAFKDIGENFLAGVIMAFKRPFRLGDTIETLGITGSIVGLNLRDTHVKTFDGKDVYIPNGQILKSPLFNYTIDGFLRQEFTIGIDYDSNIKEAIEIISYSLKQENCIIQEGKTSSITVANLSPSTIDLIVRYWINTFDAEEPGYVTKNKAIENCMHELTKAGINMPGTIIEIKGPTTNLPTL